jgi:hypothetical protein
MTRDPSGCLLKGPPPQPELMDASFHLSLHYPGLFEHFQVFRNRRLRGVESAAEFSGAADFTLRQCMNH